MATVKQRDAWWSRLTISSPMAADRLSDCLGAYPGRHSVERVLGHRCIGSEDSLPDV
jgi:hypothetical protein